MSAEMQAGIQGHAFLAAWLANPNLTAALAAFDAAADRGVHVTSPGWYSHSALGLLQTCPTKFYLSRVRHLRQKPSEADIERIAKGVEKTAALVAQARDACEWLANAGLADAGGRFTTWGTELALETMPPFKFRMLLDHLAWDHETEGLVIRDHKFTWKADARVSARMLFSDQLILYAATWNKLVPYWKMQYGWDLPECRLLVTNVVVVNAKGKHQVMPAETRQITREHEHLFWERTLREQAVANAFEIQSTANGWPWARQFMRPSQCIVFSACPYIKACHMGVEPEPGDVFELDKNSITEGDDE